MMQPMPQAGRLWVPTEEGQEILLPSAPSSSSGSKSRSRSRSRSRSSGLQDDDAAMDLSLVVEAEPVAGPGPGSSAQQGRSRVSGPVAGGLPGLSPGQLRDRAIRWLRTAGGACVRYAPLVAVVLGESIGGPWARLMGKSSASSRAAF